MKHLLRPSISSDLRHAITGALWHLSTLPEARYPIIEAGAIEPLVCFLEPRNTENNGEETEEIDNDDDDDDESRKNERILITCLTIANLTTYFDLRYPFPDPLPHL